MASIYQIEYQHITTQLIFIQKKSRWHFVVLIFFYLCTADSLAQLVEQQTLNLWVQGSIPWRVTLKKGS